MTSTATTRNTQNQMRPPQKVPRKMGVIKRFLYFLFFPIIAVFKLLWTIAKQLWRFALAIITAPVTAKRTYDEVKKRSQELEGQKITYDDIKVAWDIEVNEASSTRHQYIREMNFRMAMWTIPCAIGFLGLLTFDISNIPYCLMMLACSFFGILQPYWRKQVVLNQEFISFYTWLKPLFSWIIFWS